MTSGRCLYCLLMYNFLCGRLADSIKVLYLKWLTIWICLSGKCNWLSACGIEPVDLSCVTILRSTGPWRWCQLTERFFRLVFVAKLPVSHVAKKIVFTAWISGSNWRCMWRVSFTVTRQMSFSWFSVSPARGLADSFSDENQTLVFLWDFQKSHRSRMQWIQEHLKIYSLDMRATVSTAACLTVGQIGWGPEASALFHRQSANSDSPVLSLIWAWSASKNVKELVCRLHAGQFTVHASVYDDVITLHFSCVLGNSQILTISRLIQTVWLPDEK